MPTGLGSSSSRSASPKRAARGEKRSSTRHARSSCAAQKPVPWKTCAWRKTAASLLFADGQLSACAPNDARWLRSLRSLGQGRCVLVPEAHLPDFLELSFGRNGVSRLILPPDFERVTSREPARARDRAGRAARALERRAACFSNTTSSACPCVKKRACCFWARSKVLERDRALEDDARLALARRGLRAAAEECSQRSKRRRPRRQDQHR